MGCGGPALETPKTTVVTDGHESSPEGLEGLLRAEDALAKRSVRFLMIKMFGATRRTLIPRSGSLVARPKLPFVFGFLVTAIAVLAALSWFHRNQIDEARSAQVILNQIAVLTREINNLTLTALQEQNLTPEADTEMREARHALPKAVLAAHLHAYHTAALERCLARVGQLHYVGRPAMDHDAIWGL